MVKLSMTELTNDVRTGLSKTSSELVKQPLRAASHIVQAQKTRTQVRAFCMGMRHSDAALLIRLGIVYSLVKFSAAFVRLILTLI